MYTKIWAGKYSKMTCHSSLNKMQTIRYVQKCDILADKQMLPAGGSEKIAKTNGGIRADSRAKLAGNAGEKSMA